MFLNQPEDNLDDIEVKHSVSVTSLDNTFGEEKITESVTLKIVETETIH